jgi:hypothetical protein
MKKYSVLKVEVVETVDELDEFNSRSSLFGYNPRILSQEVRLGLCGRENTMPSLGYGALRQSNRTLKETESPKKQLACSLDYGTRDGKTPHLRMGYVSLSRACDTPSVETRNFPTWVMGQETFL